MASLLPVTVILGILSCHSGTKDPGEKIIVTDKAPCWAGKSHTLTCKLNRLRSVVEWLNENDPKPILHCSKDESSCKINPAYDEKYDFSYNVSQCTFNLTIKNVTKDYNGKKFVCSDGSYSDCEVLNVEDTKPDVQEDREKRLMSVTSACIPEERTVLFKWKKIDASNKQEIEFRPKILNTTVTNCSNECEYQLHVRRTYTFDAEPNGNERMNYTVEIDYGLGNEPIVSLISTSQKIIEYQEVEDRSSEPRTMTTLLVSLIVPATIVVAAILMVKYRRLLYKLFSNLRKADCWKERSGLERLPLLDRVIDLKAEPHLTGLMISWKSQSTSKQSGFMVTYQEMPARVLVKLPDVDSVENQSDYSVTIPDLSPGVTYKVNVQALQNVSGERVGSPLQEIIGTTVPLPVIDLEAEPNLTGLMISWKSQSTSKQSGFIVTYQEMPAGLQVKLPDLDSVENQTDYSVTIPDLSPGVTYKVNVQALQNVSGERVGSPLQEIIGTTGPLPVIDLEAEPHLTGLMISWKSQSTSKQSGFIVTYQEMPAGDIVKLPDVVSVENQTDYSITILDLFPGSTYKVNVQALQNVSGKRVGSPLQEIIGTTVTETYTCQGEPEANIGEEGEVRNQTVH